MSSTTTPSGGHGPRTPKVVGTVACSVHREKARGGEGGGKYAYFSEPTFKSFFPSFEPKQGVFFFSPAKEAAAGLVLLPGERASVNQWQILLRDEIGVHWQPTARARGPCGPRAFVARDTSRRYAPTHCQQ